MEFADKDWWVMVAETIEAVFREQGVAPTAETVGMSCWGAREGGWQVEQLRQYVASLKPTPPPFAPTRDQVCAVRMSFQGLTVNTEQFGPLPWFDTALASLTPADRSAVYTAKKAAGDTHVIIQFDDNGGSIYNEPGQPYQNVMGANLENNPTVFKSLVLEVLAAHFVPVIVLGGDNGEAGYPLAVRQLPKAIQWLKDIGAETSALIIPGYDGVFYGWIPAHVTAFGQLFRSLSTNGCLGIEHNTGHIPEGGGPADWLNGGPMQNYDVLLSEFHDGSLHEDSTWQIAARTLGPAYKRPADQPSGDDPNPPFYLKDGTPRGPYYAIAFEFYEYEFVRGLVSIADIQRNRDYLRALGYVYVC